MTLDQLVHTLPNGLHDAELHDIHVDYVQRKLKLGLYVWIGDLGGPAEKREAYRKGRIEISGLKFFVVDAPDPGYPYASNKPSRIDICGANKQLDERLLASLPDGTFLSSIWVNHWNGFAHIAALSADLIWEQDEATYRSSREHYLPGEAIETQ